MSWDLQGWHCSGICDFASLLISLALISSPENWHHWSLPLASPRLASPPASRPLHRVSIPLICVPHPPQSLSGDKWMNE